MINWQYVTIIKTLSVGADMPHIAMALPVLLIVGLKAKDIMGFV
ncbi:hypothetical protein NQT69_17760 [Pseudoalteromonas shioyasakiensis]|nr:hypothetical protein [Pseudoalteromonas shioyasakiensis]MCQ8879847.1 hypothetical protein [Pseudoalteromonas shioyasakiensis]